MSPVAIILWVAIIAVFIFFWFAGLKNKKKYEGKDMSVTEDWYEHSQSLCSQDDEKKAYFFSFDKNYLTQGHLMVDRNHQTIYEAKILYGDAGRGYETDFTNHVINYTHHHNISTTYSTHIDLDGAGTAVTSYFKFDKENIWNYLENLGYTYHFHVKGLAYQIDVMKDGAGVGTIYSSNNGKNYFDCEGPIVPKMGGNGLLVVECADRDMDALFLLAMAFARTDLSLANLK